MKKLIPLIIVLALANGWLHGQVSPVIGGTAIVFAPTGSAPSGACVAGSQGQLVASSGTVYTCQSGTWAQLSGSGGSVTFDQIGSGTNLGHGLVCGNGCVVSPAGTGFVSANEFLGVPFCTGFTPTNGQSLQYTTASSPNPCYTAAATPSSGLTQIAQSVVSGSTTSVITFSAIPQTFTNLRLVITGRCDDASTSATITAQFNGDTGTNYNNAFSYVGNIGGQGFTNGDAASNVAWLAAAQDVTGYGNTSTIEIGGYRNTSFQRTALGTETRNAGTGNGFLIILSLGSTWVNTTAAITSMTLTDSTGGHYVAGTTATLYGY